MIALRQSTAQTLRVGPAVAVGDGFTPVTSLDLSTADEAELLKHTGAVVSISAATFAAITSADGWYDLSLTTSHTDTLGMLTVVVNDDSLILPIFVRAMVMPAGVWDVFFGATAFNNLTAAQVNAEADTALADYAAASLGSTYNNLTRDDAKKAALALLGDVSGLVAGAGSGVLKRPDGSTDASTATHDGQGNKTGSTFSL